MLNVNFNMFNKLGWVEWLILIYLLGVGLFTHVHGLLLIISIYGLWKFPQYWREMDTSSKNLIWAFSGFAIIAILSATIVSESNTANHKLEKYLIFLWVVPFLFVIYSRERIGVLLTYTPAIAAILMLLAALYSAYILEQSRPMFYARNYLFFGYASAAFSMLSYIQGIYKNENRLLFYVGAIAGVVACILSGTRGALLGWFAGMAVLFLLPRVMPLKMKILMLLAALVVLASVVFNPRYMGRIETAYNSVIHNAEGEYSNTSAGLRMQMWSAAWKIFKEQPIMGVGLDGYRLKIKYMAEQGDVNRELAKFDHPHNIYLTALANMGIVGFAGLLMVFFVPVRYFYKRFKTGDAYPYATMGLVFVIMYSVFGLTEAVFEIQAITAFYAFIVSMLYAVIRNVPGKEAG